MNLNRKKGLCLLFVALIAILLMVVFRYEPRQRAEIASSKSTISAADGSSFDRVGALHPAAVTVPYLPNASPEAHSGFGRFAIMGKISSKENDPLAGAHISVYGTRPTGASFEFPSPLSWQDSDTAGRYSMNLDCPLDRGYIKIEKQGYVSIDDSLSIKTPGIANRDYILPLAEACVEGNVSDSKGFPVVNARITASKTDGHVLSNSNMAPNTAVSDSAGEFIISGLPAGRISISTVVPRDLSISQLVNVPKPQLVTLAKGPCTRLEIQLAPLVRGKVIRLVIKNRKGMPIGDAHFSFHASDIGNQNTVQGVEDGAFEWTVPFEAAGPVECTVRANGYLDKVLILDTESSQIEILLEDELLFFGRVVSTSGEAISGAHLIIPGAAGEVDTESDGTFSVAVTHPPIQLIKVTKSGFAQKILNFGKDGTPPGIEIRLNPSNCGFYGRVLDESDQPVGRFRVIMTTQQVPPTGLKGNIQFSQTFYTEDGRFSMADVEAGVYSIRVETFSGVLKTGAIPKMEILSGMLPGEIIIHVSPIK